MPETPASSESPQNSSSEGAIASEALETKNESSIENPVQNQPGTAEKLNPLEGEPVRVNSEIEQEVALPPILQETQTPQTEVAKPVSPDYIDKGAKTSSLTHVALETFRDLQRKLTLRYQRMKQGTSG